MDKHISVFHVTESIVYGILSRFPAGDKSGDFGETSAYLPAYRDKVPAANDQDIICYTAFFKGFNGSLQNSASACF